MEPRDEPVSLLDEFHIAAVLPAYNESAHIEGVIESLPAYVRTVIVVDDASTDRTAEVVTRLAQQSPRVRLVRHERNQGVGGAMISGLREAIAVGAQLVVKVDADGQMPIEWLPELLSPLAWGEADYAKGNRFRDFRALQKMPLLRRAGNMVLSFLTKAAVGYWDCFDPCNGFVAIRGDVLAELPLDRVARSFFFETSILSELYLLGAVVRDVPMPARYGDERSHLSITRTLFEFPPRLLRCFLRRVLLKNFLYDFSMESVYLLSGLPLLGLGLLYGIVNWVWYARQGLSAPTGTVVIPALAIMLGFQLLLSALGEDLRGVPRRPLCQGALKFRQPRGRRPRTAPDRAAWET